MKSVKVSNGTCEIEIILKDNNMTWIPIFSLFVDAIRGLGYIPTTLENIRDEVEG
jgi:hypothetical protein